jgi:organic hydroperoxide reductase OsmC/OhrA
MKRDKEAPADDDGPIHLVTVDWSRGKWSGTTGKYSREHAWHFGGKLALKVTDALAPAAYRDSARLDPLKSFVATVASAHMLSWLHVAFSHGAEVESYLDMAEGVLAKLPDDQSWISEIILEPRVKFNSRQQVEPSAITHFHEMAHRDCFIAQSIKTKVTVRSS